VVFFLPGWDCGERRSPSGLRARTTPVASIFAPEDQPRKWTHPNELARITLPKLFQDRGGQRQQSTTGSRPPWTVGGIHCTITYLNSGGYGLARSWVRSHRPIDLVTMASASTCGSGRVGRIHRYAKVVPFTPIRTLSAEGHTYIGTTA
jgi:hypothetical protein